MFDKDFLKRIFCVSSPVPTTILVVCRRSLDAGKFTLLSVSDIKFKCKAPIGDALHFLTANMSGKNTGYFEVNLYSNGCFEIIRPVSREELNKASHLIINKF
jgi:hypothetical protein